jgi:XTP/dITP diphosphohydrolase
MNIILASHNKGKIAEIQELLQQTTIKVIPQENLNIEEAEETGLTFVENALLKARHACIETGMPAIADDSGLVVPFLQGEPGIYSARYAGIKNDFKANIEKLLSALQNSSGQDRQAYFHCTLVYLSYPEDPSPIICEGQWYGSILTAPTGTQGFGYDPIFYDPTYQCSAAELALTIKNQISHRGQALKLLIGKLSHLCTHSS